MDEKHLARSSRWTSIDNYLVGLARDRRERDRRRPGPRSEPEAPLFSLSALPFLALLAGMAVLMVGIFAAAWPSAPPQPKPEAHAAAKVPGTAGKAWWQEAKKEMLER